MSETSDPDMWMSLHHHQDDPTQPDDGSDDDSDEIPMDASSHRVLQAIDRGRDSFSNRGIASWLLERVNRRLWNTDRSIVLKDALGNMFGPTVATPERLRQILREFSRPPTYS